MKYIFLGILSIFCLCVSSCGGNTSKSDYGSDVYAVLDEAAQKHAELLSEDGIDEMTFHGRIFDLRARCDRLLADGDTILCDYFVEKIISLLPQELADSIFKPKMPIE